MWWGMFLAAKNVGIFLSMSSVRGSGLEWMGSARVVVVSVSVFWWSHRDVLCNCVVLGSVDVRNGFCQYDIKTCLQKEGRLLA